ncbi:hypothetical protein AWB77_06736 [Caballeronia fortuita]|uniref:HNH nuclease domain-containing protein n=1 Tax=Caballeronia fortuita TaxID=1777138 RepID=A0A158EBC1_9BURK|nr:hypothetical protein AWB77_06736 [Caballeronia fortuita]
MQQEIISRADSIARGLKRYFTGKPCKRGHVSERNVAALTCIQCSNEKSAARYQSDPDRFRSEARERMAKKRPEPIKRAKAAVPAEQLCILLHVLDRRTALDRGLRHYFTGCQCVNGHLCERITSDRQCIQCKRARTRKWVVDNRESVNARQRDKQLSRYRSRSAEEKKADRAKRRTWISSYMAQYMRDNKERYVHYATRRRAAKLRAIPAWYGELDEFVMEEAALLCRIRRELTGVIWHVDHMIPLRAKDACGLHWSANVQLLPGAINASKSNRMILTEPREWILHL